MSNDPTRAALEALSRFLIGDARLDETLAVVSGLAVEALPAAAFAGLSMWEGDRVATRVSTDPESPAIDESQYASGRGPCLEAFRTGRVVRADDLSADVRWPEFQAACLAHDIGSTLSVPLLVGARCVGALNFYARAAGAFSDADQATAVLFAQSGATVLANSSAYWKAYELGETLEQALRSRAVIEQAKGILMARSKLTEGDAFELLRKASQRENRKLRDVAADIVARVVDPDAGTVGRPEV